MTEQKSSILSKGFGVGIIVVQLFDIAIHAATDQLEPLRVASNLIILAWVVILLAAKFGAKIMALALGSIGAYLGLNLIFLVLEGLTNPNTGAVRGMLFVLIFLTTALSIVLIAQQKKD